jgi:hypothetical protein
MFLLSKTTCNEKDTVQLLFLILEFYGIIHAVCEYNT